MNNRRNIINNLLMLGLTILSILAVGIITTKIPVPISFKTLPKMLLGMLLWVFINTIFHEMAHVISAKRNGFKTVSFRILWFKIHRKNGKLRISTTSIGEQIGEAEIIPISTENIEKRYKKVARAGIVANSILTIISFVFFFFWKKFFWTYNLEFLYYLTSFSFPISLYFVLANALPMSTDFSRNDGAMIWGINKNDDSTTVMISLMKAHALLYEGKTPAEIPAEYYFDVPQLPEDDPNFITLLNNRFYYYLDTNDYENAKKVILRLNGLDDYFNKSMEATLKVDVLYSYCTFMFDEEEADNLMEDYNDYINKVLNAPNLRTKLAYLLYVVKDKEMAQDFYNQALELAENIEILGLKNLEIKLIKQMEKDLI